MDYDVIKGEIEEIKDKLDAKITSFHKELTERIEELESLQMLLEAEMLQLKEIITGTTDVFFPKELEKRVELIEEFISKQPDLSKFKDIAKELEKIESSDVGKLVERVRAVENSYSSLKSELVEIKEKLKNLPQELEKGIDSSLLEEMKSRIERMEELKKSLEFLMKDSERLRQEFTRIDVEIEKVKSASMNAEQYAKEAKSLVSRAEAAAKTIEDLLEARMEKLEKLEARVESRVSSLEARIEELSKLLEVKGSPDLSRLEQRTANAIKIAESVSSQAKEIENAIKDIRKDVDNLKKAVSDLTMEEIEDRIRLRLEESKIAKAVPVLVERYRMLEDDITEIRDEIDLLKNISSPEHMEKIRKMEERVEELERELEKKLELLHEGHIAGIIERIRDIDGKMNAFEGQWEKLEEALRKAEEAKNSAISLRNEIDVQVEALTSKMLEQAMSAVDKRITKTEFGITKLEQHVSNLSAEVDKIVSMMPSFRESMERISEMERSVKREREDIEKLKREIVEEGERIKEEVEHGVDARILKHLKDFARKLDQSLPAFATKSDIEELRNEIEKFSLPQKIDISSITQSITERLDRLEAEIEELRRRKQVRPFPFMIE